MPCMSPITSRLPPARACITILTSASAEIRTCLKYLGSLVQGRPCRCRYCSALSYRKMASVDRMSFSSSNVLSAVAEELAILPSLRAALGVGHVDKATRDGPAPPGILAGFGTSHAAAQQAGLAGGT